MTAFETVYENFFDLVREHDLDVVDEDTSNQILYGWLKFAIARFTNCIKDLSKINEEEKSFIEDLDLAEVQILAQFMVLASLKPKLHNSDLFKNGLSTKDYSTFSPANLLNSIQSIYNATKADINDAIIRYSNKNNDVSKWVK